MKIRLDALMVELGLAASGEQARRYIMAGLVDVEGLRNPKPGNKVDRKTHVHLRAVERYVSRGGWKLHHALETFTIDVSGRVAIDFGASTGGFTDCLLQAGATKVYAVDVGESLLHDRIRQDERVVVRDRVNARSVGPDLFDPAVTLIVTDLSFISLTKVLEAWAALYSLSDNALELVALIKPQFECTPKEVSRGRGIIKDAAIHLRVLQEVTAFASQAGWQPMAVAPSPIRGGSGNVEFLFHAIRAAAPAALPPEWAQWLENAVHLAHHPPDTDPNK